ncbi:thioredoxin family protein [uncultured Paraglaciecola sp.]|uniref:thioredoxin family protein n=1 Tax=uncultured Paraglaciecola sp. TaxID=1765024 RepID=UPI0030DDAD3D|tara:strand:+ start:13409 stop:13903 length:495 start_codon:yes stop_codon:yes gene_type:complete
MLLNKQHQRGSTFSKSLVIGGIILLLSVLGYYGNKAVQSFLGQQAIEQTGLQLHTLEQALQLAKSTDKLVLADMSAIWCPSCRKLDQQVFSDTRVKDRLNQHFVYARIEYDSEAGKSFMQDYQVTGFPTLLVLNSQGEKLVKLPLSFEALPFLSNLEKVVNANP